MMWQARIQFRVAVASWVEGKEGVVIDIVLRHLNRVRLAIDPAESELVWDDAVRVILPA
jgi:hypothetical protein